MSMSEYKLYDFFRYFDADNSGQLDYEEMFLMGESMGISRKIMSSMIKEIDVNGDGTIELEEWIDQIRGSKQSNQLEIRGEDDHNILLDFIDHSKGDKDAMRRKKNLNIHDNQKLNEIELQDAISIAKDQNIKIRKQESENYSKMQKLYVDQKYSDEIKD